MAIGQSNGFDPKQFFIRRPYSGHISTTIFVIASPHPLKRGSSKIQQPCNRNPKFSKVSKIEIFILVTAKQPAKFNSGLGKHFAKLAATPKPRLNYVGYLPLSINECQHESAKRTPTQKCENGLATDIRAQIRAPKIALGTQD